MIPADLERFLTANPAVTATLFLFTIIELRTSLMFEREEPRTRRGCIRTHPPVVPEFAIERHEEPAAARTVARRFLPARTTFTIAISPRFEVRRQFLRHLPELIVKAHALSFLAAENKRSTAPWIAAVWRKPSISDRKR